MRPRLSSPTEELPGGSVRLTPEVVNVLAQSLLAGRTRREIAEQLGISVRSVTRWKQSPLVITEMERLKSRTDEVRAADVLLRLMESEDERVSLRAAELVITHRIQRAPVEPDSKQSEPPPEAAAAVVLRIEKGDDLEEITIKDGDIVDG